MLDKILLAEFRLRALGRKSTLEVPVFRRDQRLPWGRVETDDTGYTPERLLFGQKFLSLLADLALDTQLDFAKLLAAISRGHQR